MADRKKMGGSPPLDFFRDDRKNKVALMLDSGAFSVQFTGEVLELKDYMKYIEANHDLLATYVNLDTVPISPEKSITRDYEASAQASYNNLKAMRKAGLHPIPVFHMGEDWKWLRRLVDDGEPYIGLSTNKDLFPTAHQVWLDKCFTMLTDEAGHPLVMTHGFGITTHSLLIRYPWTTCDSTTWSLSAGYGKIFVPPYENGKANYWRPPLALVTSGVKQNSAGNQSKQYHFLLPSAGAGGFHQKMVQAFLDDCGLTISDVRNDDGARRRAITYYYKQLEKLPVPTFKYRLSNFGFGQKNFAPVKRDPVIPNYNGERRVIFAHISTSKEFSQILTDLDAFNRLLSYYDLRKRAGFLEHHIATGLNPATKEIRRQKVTWGNKSYEKRRVVALSRRNRAYEQSVEGSADG